MKILFLNFERGFDCGSQLMQGWTGKTYGTPSRWHPTLAAQSVELEVRDEAEWLKVIRDLKDAWHMPLRRWVPMPPFHAERPLPVMEFEAGYNLGMDARQLPDEASEAAKAGYAVATKHGGEVAEEDDLRGTPFFKLRKIAKDLGVDAGGIKGAGNLKKAIRQARTAQAKQPAGV